MTIPRHRIALQPASGDNARRNAVKTLDRPISLASIETFLTPEDCAALEVACPNGKVYVWGVTKYRRGEFRRLRRHECVALFYRARVAYRCGRVVHCINNPRLAAHLWPHASESWPLIYFLKDVQSIFRPISEINPFFGWQSDYAWRKFVVRSLLTKELAEVIEPLALPAA